MYMRFFLLPFILIYVGENIQIIKNENIIFIFYDLDILANVKFFLLII